MVDWTKYHPGLGPDPRVDGLKIDWDKATTEPKVHQVVGSEWLHRLDDPARGRVSPGVNLLGDDVGCGKSKQEVDAKQQLFIDGAIDAVCVFAPAAGRGVWADHDPAMGEVARHGWRSIDNVLIEYSSGSCQGKRRPLDKVPKPGSGALPWIVTNYEFARRDDRLLPLLDLLSKRRFAVVFDEAWALKDSGSDQWKAAARVRKLAARASELNGTPIADTPLDLFGEFGVLDKSIVGYKYFSHFRARYAILKPNVTFPLITGWQNLEELTDRTAPYVLQRPTRECWDLPEELEPILVEARMTDEEWRLYRQMRDDMVAFIDGSDEASIAKQAIVRGVRLAQICSGFLGGLQKVEFEEWFGGGDSGIVLSDGLGPIFSNLPPKEIGRSKLDAALAFLERYPNRPARELVWSRFRPEIERTAKALEEQGRTVKLLYGGQTKAEREDAKRLLNPDIPPPGPCSLVGSRAAGGAALNFSGAGLELNLSYTFLLREYLQARGRIERPGLRDRFRRVDVCACGPRGQKTVDHHVVAALRGKRDVANWTAREWKRALLEE